jgi:DNA polymerase-1
MTLTVGKKIPLSTLALDQWLNLIQKATVIAFDTETTGLKVHSGEDTILGFSIAFDSEFGVLSEYFPVAHIRGENLEDADWKAILGEVVKKPLIIYNAIFDLNVLTHMGYEVTRFFCAQKIDHLINENHNVYSLDQTTTRWLGYAGKEKSAEFELAMLAYGWAGMPSEVMYHYAKTDAGITLEAFNEEIKHREFTPKLNKFWKEIEAPNIKLLSKMRQRGVRIDIDKCKVEEAKGKAVMSGIAEELGGNPASPIFLKKALLEDLGLPEILKKNKKGEFRQTFDKDAMKRYELMLERESSNNDIASKILTYRGWQKAVSGYYLPYQKFVERDGRLRAEYKPHGTVTGRYSCADPNLQQIPKETDKPWNGAVKSCLIAEDGYKLWELDYSQLEFRLAASAAKEEKLLEIFNDGSRDIFTEMAAHLGMERQATKTLTYSIQYGAGTQRIMDVFGVTKGEATDIIGNFYEQYPGLKRAGQAAGQQAKTTGYVDIWSGRRRHFKYPKDEYYKAFNSYVQGGAADLVKKVMVDCEREGLNNEENRLLLQVHDSLVWEIAVGREEYYLPRIAEVMTAPDFGVRMAVDAHEWSKS